MSYKKYINYSLKGIMIGSLVVGSFLQMDEKVAKAVEEGETPTFEEDGIIYITPEATKEAGQKIFSDPNWITGLDNHATQQEVPLNQKLSANQYKDYDSSAYWAKDMKWAIDQGLVTGYQNQKHPSTPSKGLGNWIDSSGNLTEYQMLNVMLRYKDGANFESAKTTMKAETASNFAYVEYFFANQHGMVTKGSMSDASFAKQQVTRGQMAQALVSMHYGKPVTVQQAVDFMYANGITTGVNPSKGQTLDNFGANTKLARAHIVAFMGRYNEAVKAGTIKDTLNGDYIGNRTVTPPSKDSGNDNGSVSTINPAPPTFDHTKYNYFNLYGQFDTSKKFTQDGIKVSYKNHTYNVKSQAEYDQVMNYVSNRIEGVTLHDLHLELLDQLGYSYMEDLEYGLQVLERLMNNEITIITDRSNPEYRSKENSKANGYNLSYSDAISQGVSFDTLAKFTAASQYVDGFTGGASTAWGPPESAYDFFIKNEVDCTSWAYGRQAIYDALGYNTAVVHWPGANHDFLIIELDGKWFSHESALKVFDKSSFRKSEYSKYDPFIKYAPIKNADKLDFIKIGENNRRYFVNGVEVEL